MGDRRRGALAALDHVGGQPRARRSQALALVLFALTIVHENRALAASALGSIAPEIAKGIGNAPPSTLVVASALESDVSAPKGDELSTKVAALVAGKLGPTARAAGSPLTLAAARGAAGKSGALLYLRVQIDKGRLRVTADEYPVIGNPWDRVRLPPPPPSAHAFAEAPIDAEIRAALTPIVLEQASVHKAKHAEREVLAAACGDVDGDGGMELVIVSRGRVAVGDVRGGAFAATKVAAWSELSRRAPVPMRDPLASAAVTPGVVAVGSSDYGGALLDASLKPSASPPAGMPVQWSWRAIGCAHTSPEASAFAGELTPCEASTQLSFPAMPTPKYDAIASFETARARWVALREPSGKVRVRATKLDETGQNQALRELVAVEGAGAQLALGDLDQDGVPELASSSDGADDALSIASLDDAGPRARMKLPAPDGIRALCTCPPEERGVPVLVAVTSTEVWIVR